MSCKEEKQAMTRFIETEIICYCNRITKQEIRKTIKETGLRTIPEIKDHLRDDIISNCVELNPTGNCCHNVFNAVIQQVLENS